VLEHSASSSLVGSSVASSSEEKNGLARLDVLGVKTLALCDARVMW